MARCDVTARVRCRTGMEGFTLGEMLIVVAMLAVLAFISVPLITRVLAQSKAQGGGDAIMGAIREARTRAVQSGWQYRVVGYSAGGTVANSFRIEGSSDPTTVGWPAQTAGTPRTYTAALFWDHWTSLTGEFGGTQVTPTGGDTFIVSFNSNGMVPAGPCGGPCITGFPLTVNAPSATPRTVTVNGAGTVYVR